MHFITDFLLLLLLYCVLYTLLPKSYHIISQIRVCTMYSYAVIQHKNIMPSTSVKNYVEFLIIRTYRICIRLMVGHFEVFTFSVYYL
jgi:hypothetical protein